MKLPFILVVSLLASSLLVGCSGSKGGEISKTEEQNFKGGKMPDGTWDKVSESADDFKKNQKPIDWDGDGKADEGNKGFTPGPGGISSGK